MDNNISKTIGNRINTLLAEHGVKQKELAQHLQIPDNTISYFVKGTRIPNTQQIIKIAQYFNVSADYLLGLSNAESPDNDIQFISKRTGLSERAINALNKFYRVAVTDEENGTLITATQTINRIIETNTIHFLSAHINDYCTYIKAIKDNKKLFFEKKKGNVEISLEEQSYFYVATDKRDLALFRAQETLNSFIKKICKEDIQEIESYDKKINDLEYQLIKELAEEYGNDTKA